MAEILVIEDDIIVQHVHKLMFDKLNYPIQMVDTGTAALNLLNDNPPFKIIFVDLGLPDMDGYDLIRTLRSKLAAREKFPIIALTGYIGDSEKAACLKAGATEVMHKPIMLERLQAMLEAYLDGKER